MTTSQIEALWALAVARSTFRPVVVRTTNLGKDLNTSGIGRYVRYRLCDAGTGETAATGVITPSGRFLADW